MFVETQIGHHRPRLSVLLFELPQASEFAGTETAILLLSAVERLLGDAHFPDHLGDGSPRLGLLHGKGNLAFGVLRLAQGKILLSWAARRRQFGGNDLQKEVIEG